MDIREAKRIFLVAKASENVTGRTLGTYKDVFKKFLGYLYEQNLYDISVINTSHIREFLVSLKDGRKGVTVHKYFRVLRTFFLFMLQEDYIESNPMKTVKAPKKEKKVMRTFTAAEISRLLNAFDRTTYFGMRNYCVMAMFFSTGMRKGELRNLTLADVNVTTDLIRIDGKGQKERLAPISRTLRRALRQYMKMRSEFLGDESCEWLFVTPRASRKMTDSCLNMLFGKLKRELGLNGERVSSHTWRHTFAKTYLLNGGDIFSLQEILGHSDIETTKIYLSLNEQEIKVQHAKYNPLDNKDWLH